MSIIIFIRLTTIYKTAMTLFSNIFRCFGDVSKSQRRVCTGGVCVLKEQSKLGNTRSETKRKRRNQHSCF
ncbi:hypothetical protein NC651_039009 [Populus alba x Populus x berolinensis]|nr:hypothetical protein NC651_039009 [Populus alba x Populus x berolinensis]